MNISQDGVLFRSDKNYMKRDKSSGHTNMLGPNQAEYFGNVYTRELVINHELGYVPFFRAYYEPYQDGKLFPIVMDTDYVLSSPINDFTYFTDTAPVMIAEASENELVLTMFFVNNSLAAVNFPVYWVIYKDYGLGV